MSDLYLPKYCILEAPIRECEEIPDAAKIYFGELAVLASKYNYIPYSDEALAKMKGVDERTIKRWHADLENHGFIKRKTQNELIPGEKCKWLKKRKIFIYQQPNSNNVSEGDKNVPFDEGDKNVPSSIQDSKQDKKQQHGSAVVFSCLKDKNIPPPDKKRISKAYSEDDVKRAVEWTDNEERLDLIRTSYLQALNWACKNVSSLTLSEDTTDTRSSNREQIKGIFSDSEEGFVNSESEVPIKYEILTNYIGFDFGPMRYETFNFEDNNCLLNLKKWLRKWIHPNETGRLNLA